SRARRLRRDANRGARCENSENTAFMKCDLKCDLPGGRGEKSGNEPSRRAPRLLERSFRESGTESRALATALPRTIRERAGLRSPDQRWRNTFCDCSPALVRIRTR